MQLACALQMIIPQIFVVQQRFNQFLNCTDKSKNVPQPLRTHYTGEIFSMGCNSKNVGWVLGGWK